MLAKARGLWSGVFRSLKSTARQSAKAMGGIVHVAGGYDDVNSDHRNIIRTKAMAHFNLSLRNVGTLKEGGE